MSNAEKADSFPVQQLAPAEQEQLQQRLWTLLSRRMRLYAIGSSSVRSETADELLSSICFLLRLWLQQNNLPLRFLLQKDPEAVLNHALEAAKALTQQSAQLYRQINKFPLLPSSCLHDTLAEIAAFFRRYDLQFFAHQIPCLIDYPLCCAVLETQYGILYIQEYLWRLQAELRFLGAFPQKEVCTLLDAACPGWHGLPLNLCEPVLLNATGRTLLQKSTARLHLTCQDCTALQTLLCSDTAAKGTALLKQGAYTAAQQAGLTQPDAAYLAKAAAAQWPRIAAAADLQKIFVSF